MRVFYDDEDVVYGAGRTFFKFAQKVCLPHSRLTETREQICILKTRMFNVKSYRLFMTDRERMKKMCVCVCACVMMIPKILSESMCLSERKESVFVFASNG